VHDLLDHAPPDLAYVCGALAQGLLGQRLEHPGVPFDRLVNRA
jgi:hypothetical protein